MCCFVDIFLEIPLKIISRNYSYELTSINWFGRKKGTAKWEGIIHEKLVSKSPVKYIKGDILHYSYPSISFHLSKINHFTDFMAKEMFEKGKKGSLTKLILSPPFKFIKKYIFQLGFLDGYAGFIVSIMSAYYVFVKYAKLRSLIKDTII